MDDSVDRLNHVQPGATVHGSDGEKMGSIIEIGPDYVVVEKGLFFPTDYFVPTGAIASIDGDRVTLTMTRDEALAQGWETDPAERAPETAATPETDPGFRGDFDGVAVTGFGPAVEAQPGDPVRTGFATEVGTTPPAADFQTLGVAPVDVNTAYTGDDAEPDQTPMDEPAGPGEPVARSDRDPR